MLHNIFKFNEQCSAFGVEVTHLLKTTKAFVVFSFMLLQSGRPRLAIPDGKTSKYCSKNCNWLQYNEPH